MRYPTTAIETISPARATRWLKRHIDTGFGNRTLNRQTIDALKRSAVRGEWRSDNGENIKLGPNGEILDGQHRLVMITETGLTLKMGVTRNVPIDAMPTVGIPKTRSVADMLTIGGVRTDLHLLSAAALLMTAYANRGSNSIMGVTRGKNTTKPEVFDRASADDNLAECVALTRRHFKPAVFPNLSAIAFCWRIGRGLASRGHVDAFFESLAKGADLGSRDPRLALRNKLIEIRISGRSRGTRTDVSVVIYHIMRALGAYMRAEKLTKLALPRTGVLEFPKVPRSKRAA